MTIALALLCFSLAADPPAHAPDGTTVVILKSHDQLMKLSDDDREEYLEAVRESLAEYEKRMGKYLDEVSANDRIPSPFSFVAEVYAEDAKAPEFRCLYAGWPVQGAKCRPQTSVKYKVVFAVKTLERGAVMQDEIVMSLSCPNRQTLCNPVVFGTTLPKTEELGGPYPEKSIRPTGGALADLVRSKVKPVCVNAGDRRNVSRECYYKSIEMRAVPNPKYNPELWADFEKGFNAMCTGAGVTANSYFRNRTRAAQDMKDTCAWTQARLNRANPDTRRRRSYGPDRDYKPEDRRSNEAESAR